jgi:hypothetical protein
MFHVEHLNYLSVFLNSYPKKFGENGGSGDTKFPLFEKGKGGFLVKECLDWNGKLVNLCVKSIY